MKAVVQTGYGSPDVLELREIDRPVPGGGDVLVRVQAASLHAGDYFGLGGSPFAARMTIGLFRPKANYIPGLDAAGTVETVGRNVTRLRPGDEVFGSVSGACAEYACAAEDRLVPKPVNVTFEQAAASPTSGLTALLGVRDAGKVQPGQKVLINGASGGVGTFAVQIARALGAEVTGVCSTANVDTVRSIGAEHVVDYTREDFAQGDKRYDLILDNIASRSFSDLKRVLTPSGTVIPNSGHGGMRYVMKAILLSMFVRQQGSTFVSLPKHADLVLLRELMESGRVTPVVDRTYPLEEVPEAFRYLLQGHARGKVVITVGGNGDSDTQNRSAEA
jgi:NADPH:quinone reductase-like Zn-dependent oxidoreductase